MLLMEKRLSYIPHFVYWYLFVTERLAHYVLHMAHSAHILYRREGAFHSRCHYTSYEACVAITGRDSERR